MITPENIADLFRQYKQHKREEARIEERLRTAGSDQEWVENLQHKAGALRQMYLQNENYLDMYWRPFMKGREKLTEELALALFDELLQMFNEYLEDDLLIIEVGELLESFFKDNGMAEKHITTMAILSVIYSNLPYRFFGDRTMYMIEGMIDYIPQCAQLQDSTARQNLIFAVANRAYVLISKENLSAEHCIDTIEEVVQIYNDPEFRNNTEKLVNLEEHVRRVKNDLILAALKRPKKDDYGKKLADYAYEPLTELYQEELQEVLAEEQCEFDIEIRIYFCYYKILLERGEITREECYKAYRRYFDYHMTGHMLMDVHNPEFSSSVQFALMLEYLDELLAVAPIEEKEPLIQQFCEYIKAIPKKQNDIYVTTHIYNALQKILPEMTETIDPVELLLSVIVERDIAVTVHVRMVSTLAMILLEMVFEREPGLLVGCLGTTTVEEVESRRKEFFTYLCHAGYLHDVGKVNISYVTKNQIRRLNDIEYACISKHPELGVELVSGNEALRCYVPAILGHHKSWNDQRGYPYEYLRHVMPEAILVDLIQLSDCIDSATDYLGRTYAMSKTSQQVLEEFRKDSGTVYNPRLVELLSEDKGTQKRIADLTTGGRIDICCDIYKEYYREEQ